MEVRGLFHVPVTSPPGRKATGTYWMGYFDSRAGMDALEKIKISYPYKESNPD
jgi:hypothetical protein